MASVLSLGRGAGRRGVSEALEVLSGSRREEDEERRSRVEAWEEEEALSYPEAQVDPWEVRTALWAASPWAGVGACQGAVVPVLDLIPEGQEVEAPCREVQAGAWASEAFLDACCQEGRVVVQVEAHHLQPVGLVPLHLGAWPLKGASLEASIQEEEREERREVACLAWASQIPGQSGQAWEQTVVAGHLQTADGVCRLGKVGFVQPGVALRPSRVALLWNPS